MKRKAKLALAIWVAKAVFALAATGYSAIRNRRDKKRAS